MHKSLCLLHANCISLCISVPTNILFHDCDAIGILWGINSGTDQSFCQINTIILSVIQQYSSSIETLHAGQNNN